MAGKLKIERVEGVDNLSENHSILVGLVRTARFTSSTLFSVLQPWDAHPRHVKWCKKLRRDHSDQRSTVRSLSSNQL